MPYIKKDQRDKFNVVINRINTTIHHSPMTARVSNAGELNYLITKLLHSYLETHGLSYATLNEIHGVLSCADKEFYRKVTAPYEERKIKENGDVRPDVSVPQEEGKYLY